MKNPEATPLRKYAENQKNQKNQKMILESDAETCRKPKKTKKPKDL